MHVAGRDFNDHFRAQYPQIVSELDFLLGDRELARDVAQDAFTKQFVAWTRLAHYDKPGAWVRRVALRIAFRAKRRLTQLFSSDEAADTPAAETDPTTTVDVRNAVLQLAPAQRTAVVLHYFRDMPIAEVAQIVGVQESTVRAQLYQARLKLAEILVNYRPGGLEEIS